MKRVWVLVVTVALIAGMVGCGSPARTEYSLTIGSIAGGSVTSPEKAELAYGAGRVVELVAVADEGYRFVRWTGDVGTVADVSAASTTITMNGEYSITAVFEEDEVVHFPDPNLEAEIRRALGKEEGPIYGSELEQVTALRVYSRHICDLSGLEYCTNLIHLYLLGNRISDVSPLAGLTNLTVLHMMSNQISDLSPLAGLTNLAELNLSGNQVSDLSPLGNLTSLTWIRLYRNQISDLSPLAGLTNLYSLELQHNEISDIKSLVQNEGLGEGNNVNLRGNPLSPASRNTYIPQLQARGVIVHY